MQSFFRKSSKDTSAPFKMTWRYCKMPVLKQTGRIYLFAITVNKLGHVTDLGKLEVVESTADDIRQPENLTRQRERPSIPRLCNFTWHLASDVLRMDVPLIKRCGKNSQSRSVVSCSCKQTVNRLKDLFTTLPNVVLHIATGHYTVYTDECNCPK